MFITNLSEKTIHGNDEKAFKKLFNIYYPTLFLYCKRFIENREIREDIVQDTFITLWSKKNEISFDESAVFYLKACVRNGCINYLKHQSCEQKYIDKILERKSFYDQGEDSLYTVKELQGMLKQSLDKLPEKCKRAYLLSYMEGKTNAEIAEILGMSTKTVERYKNKSMDHLKKELKDYLPSFLFDILYF